MGSTQTAPGVLEHPLQRRCSHWLGSRGPSQSCQGSCFSWTGPPRLRSEGHPWTEPQAQLTQ